MALKQRDAFAVTQYQPLILNVSTLQLTQSQQTISEPSSPSFPSRPVHHQTRPRKSDDSAHEALADTPRCPGPKSIPRISIWLYRTPRATHPTGTVIAPTGDLIPRNLDTPHRVLMPRQGMHQFALFHIPDFKIGIPRAGNSHGTTVDRLYAPNSRRMSRQGM